MTSVRLNGNRLRLRNGKLTLVAAAVPRADNGSGYATPDESAMLDYAIHQRVGTSKTIPVSATITGADGVVEMRAVYDADGVYIPLGEWAAMGTSAGGAVSSALMVQQDCWYRLQTRKAGNPGAVTTGTKRFGVGKRVIVFGQSNILNLSASALLYPLSDDKTRRFKAGAWARIGNWKAGFPPGTPFAGAGGYGDGAQGATPNGDGMVNFANALRAGLNIPIGTFEYAVGGTPIASWLPGSGTHWNTLIAALNAAGGDCEEALWGQGEEDANAGTSAAAYQAGLLAIFNGLKTQTGRNDFRLAVVILGPTTNYGPEGSFGRIRAAQLAFVANNPGAYIAAVAIDATLGDSVHINAASQARMGRRYAHASLTGRSGAKITGATRSGNVVTVAISGGTGALKDGAGGNGASLKGHRFFDAGAAGAQITTTATQIAGNTVLYTLASTPVGALTFDFAMANLPFSNPPLAVEILYDSDTVPGDTLGLPLQPCAAITVTGS